VNLTILPLGEPITIQAIFNNDDKRIPYAKPGESVKVIRIPSQLIIIDPN
jgi:hypothetical protein